MRGPPHERRRDPRGRRHRRLLRREPDPVRRRSLGVEQGQTLALLGRNGAGKITTMKAIIGLAPPRRGSDHACTASEIHGQTAVPHRARRHRLRAGGPPDLSRAFGRGQSADRRQEGPRTASDDWTVKRIYDVFPLLAPLRARMAGRLSGGEQQMLDHRAHADGQSRRCCCSTSRARAWRRSSCERIGELLRRLREHGHHRPGRRAEHAFLPRASRATSPSSTRARSSIAPRSTS